MYAIHSWQGFGPHDIGQMDGAVQVRKQGPFARWLPFQIATKGIRLKRQQDQVVFVREMSGGGRSRLLARGCPHLAS